MSDEEKLDCTPFPCGCCLPCRINKARTWQHRIMLESKSHNNSAFTTLTYNDDHLKYTDDGYPNLVKSDLQKFLKRLRRRLNYGIRYFGVGEYGDLSERPHYHVCLFGIEKCDYGFIEKSWSLQKQSIGHIYTGTVTSESARYIAGYTIKKLTKSSDDRLFGRDPEFMLSSRKDGGIGLPQVIKIAGRLKNNPYFDINQVINTFKIGGKSFPLGGYLTNKLFDELGTPEELRKKYLEDWQEKIFAEYNIQSEDYYFNICESDNQKVRSLEKKHNIYKKEKTL